MDVQSTGSSQNNGVGNGVQNADKSTPKYMGSITRDEETGELVLDKLAKKGEKLKLSKEGLLNVKYSIALYSTKKYAENQKVLPEDLDNNYMNNAASRYAAVLEDITAEVGDVPGQFKKHREVLDNVLKNALNLEANRTANQIAFDYAINDEDFQNWSIEERNAKILEIKSQITTDLTSINSKFTDLFTDFMKDNTFEDALRLTNSKLAESLTESEKEIFGKLNKDYGNSGLEFVLDRSPVGGLKKLQDIVGLQTVARVGRV